MEGVVSSFERFLREERGLAPCSCRSYCSKAREFLRHVGGEDGLRSLTAGDVTGFVVSHSSAHCWETARAMVTALRALLRYAHVAGLSVRLEYAVPTVARWRGSEMPRPVDAEQVRALVSGAGLSPGRSERDIAVVLLMARLGLRTVEVTRLEIGDVDWSAGILVVRGKGGQIEKLPLPVDVGQALVRYLRVRPTGTTARELFLSLTVGHRPLNTAAVREIVRIGCLAGGVEPFSPHRLRHALACSMLAQGMGLAQIGQVLRHRSMASTAIYAVCQKLHQMGDLNGFFRELVA